MRLHFARAHRLRTGPSLLLPFSSSGVCDQPDLYGPIMLCFTLALLLDVSMKANGVDVVRVDDLPPPHASFRSPAARASAGRDWGRQFW